MPFVVILESFQLALISLPTRSANTEDAVMRQIWIAKVGLPEVLEVKEAPHPEPKAGEVRIRVKPSGVNFADIMSRLGLYPVLLPSRSCLVEVSGHVDAVGTVSHPIGLAVMFWQRLDLAATPILYASR